MRYLVWHRDNGSRESAETIIDIYEQPTAVARMFARSDTDGMTDGLYTRDGHEIQNLARDGHPICVEDEAGNVTEWRVGVVEFEPVFRSVKVEGGK